MERGGFFRLSLYKTEVFPHIIDKLRRQNYNNPSKNPIN